MSTTTQKHLIGLHLPARLAEMLNSTTRLYDRPRFYALTHTTDHVQRLFEALSSPGEARIATVAIQQQPQSECFGVPFDDLRQEARLALNGLYLFEEENGPALWPAVERLNCLVTPFEEPAPQAGQEEILLKLPMRISPPWEMVAPSYIGCQEAAARISRLTPALLEKEPYLSLCLLQGANRLEHTRRCRVAALSAARPDARALLLGTDTSIFYCFYRKTLAGHPLLAPYQNAFEPAVLGE